MESMKEFRFGYWQQQFGCVLPLKFEDVADLQSQWQEIDSALRAWLEQRGKKAAMLLFAIELDGRPSGDCLNDFQQAYQDHRSAGPLPADLQISVAVYGENNQRVREMHWVRDAFCTLDAFRVFELARNDSNIEATFHHGKVENVTLRHPYHYFAILLGMVAIAGSCGFFYFFSLVQAPALWLLMPTCMLLAGIILVIRFTRVTTYCIDRKLGQFTQDMRSLIRRRHCTFAATELKRVEVESYLELQGSVSTESGNSVTRFRVQVRLANSNRLEIWKNAEWMDARALATVVADMLGLSVKDRTKRRPTACSSPCDIAEQQLPSS